jgi:16S rRNA (guanine1207-N2)-methyltransferase
VANKRVGVRGCIAFTRKRFGRCGVIRQKQGYHVALAIRSSEDQSSRPEGRYISRSLKLNGIETTLVSKPGVFSWNRLDDGTAALVSTMEMGEADVVLDLGCGAGLAGLAAARAAPHGEVVLIDADVRAVESTRRTLTANGIENAEAFLSDCASVLLSSGAHRRFDVVIANPPFHQGRGVDFDVARQFVVDAARVLRIGGRLFLVGNRFLRYGELIKKSFGNVITAYTDNRYLVLKATRRKCATRQSYPPRGGQHI